MVDSDPKVVHGLEDSTEDAEEVEGDVLATEFQRDGEDM